MATLKPTIVKAKVLKDGGHKIRIAVCHKSETAYIITRFTVQENQFKNGQVIKRPDASVINMQLRKLMNKYQERLDAIKFLDIYTCSQIKDIISSKSIEDRNTFGDVSREFIKELHEQNRISYATLIERNCRYFTNFAHGEVMLTDITPVMIQNYANFIRKRGVTETTVNTMLSQTKAVINRAIKEQLVSYAVHPFITTKISVAPVRKLDLTLSSFNKIRMATFKKRKFRMAKDLFLLSFYLGGINLIDIMSIDFRKEKIEYSRTKTEGRMQNGSSVVLTIQPVAREIINEWIDRRTGKLDFGYKFTYHNFSQYVTYSLQSIAAELNINERISFYSARKSFAQYASDIGIPTAIIDYLLGHSDKSRGVIRYYAKVRERQADVAIKRVIDYVNNPDKYKEYIELRNDIMLMRG